MLDFKLFSTQCICADLPNTASPEMTGLTSTRCLLSIEVDCVFLPLDYISEVVMLTLACFRSNACAKVCLQM